MMRSYNQRTFARRGAALLVAGTLALSPLAAPTLALGTSTAQLQQELAAAQQQLDSLQAALDQAEAELGKTNYELDQTQEEMDQLQVQIEETEAELVVARKHLSEVIESTYKQGKPNLIDLVLSADDFDELFSRIYYANKVSISQKEAINTVTDLQASLESDQEALRLHEQELTALLESQQAQQAEAEAAAAAQASYIGQLSSELQAALEAERAAAAEASRRAAEEAQRAEQERQQSQAESGDAGSSSDGSSSSESSSSESSSSSSSESSSSSSSESSESSYTEPSYYEPTPAYVEPTPSYDSSGSLHDIALSAALSQVGKAYGHANDGNSWDCNGLTNWAWAQAGVSIPYASGHYSYGQFQWMKNSGRYVWSMSQLQPGDLVFFSYDGGSTCYHVAMYVGGGMVVHALSYSQGVQVTPVDWCDGFCGGGSPV